MIVGPSNEVRSLVTVLVTRTLKVHINVLNRRFNVAKYDYSALIYTKAPPQLEPLPAVQP
jgi:hypothetical protein